MRVRPFHVFNNSYGAILINTEKMEASRIDNFSESILQTVDPYNCNIALLDEDIKSILYKFDLIADNSTPVFIENREDMPIVNMTLNIIQECNLGCIYCYGNKGTYDSAGIMDQSTAFKAVDWLIEHSKNKDRLFIGFFGGEPLLNFSLLKKVVQYAELRGKQTKKDFDFSINTNGTLIDENKIKFFKKHGIVPHVSFDGPKEIQDSQRPFKNGSGSYDQILPKIRQLIDEIPQVTCRPTVLGGIDPIEIDIHLREIGFQVVHLNFASQNILECREKINIPRDLPMMLRIIEPEYENLINAIKHKHNKLIHKLNKSGALCSILGQFLNKQKRFFPCGAGRGYVAISYQGDIYLCHRFVGSKQHHLGNIFSGQLNRDDYLSSPLSRNGKCSKCFAQYICAGGCYHDNAGETGSVFEPASDVCHVTKKVVELAAAVSVQLDENERKFLYDIDAIPKKPCVLDLF